MIEVGNLELAQDQGWVSKGHDGLPGSLCNLSQSWQSWPKRMNAMNGQIDTNHTYSLQNVLRWHLHGRRFVHFIAFKRNQLLVVLPQKLAMESPSCSCSPPKHVKQAAKHDTDREWSRSIQHRFVFLVCQKSAAKGSGAKNSAIISRFFEATAPLLDCDPTLWIISAWNDNGFDAWENVIQCDKPTLRRKIITVIFLGNSVIIVLCDFRIQSFGLAGFAAIWEPPRCT